MSDSIDRLVETVRTACEVIDDEGSTPSRPCTVYGDALTELATIAREADKWRKAAERLAISVGVAHWHMLVVHGHAPDDGYIEKSARVEIAEALATVE